MNTVPYSNIVRVQGGIVSKLPISGPLAYPALITILQELGYERISHSDDGFYELYRQPHFNEHTCVLYFFSPQDLMNIQHVDTSIF